MAKIRMLRVSCFGTVLVGLLVLLIGLGGVPAQAQSRAEFERLEQELAEERQARQALLKRIEKLEQQSGQQTSQVEDLENQIFEVEAQVGQRSVVHGFDSLSMDLGGFLTQSFSVGIGEDSTKVSFNQTLFELIAGVQVNEDVSFAAALGWLRESELDVSDRKRPTFRDFSMRVPQIIVWANYRYSDAVELQVGRFITPHGIINIEHFPPLLLDHNQPQFLRPFSGATIFPNFVSGGQLHGKFLLGKAQQNILQYNSYVGVFSGGSPDNVTAGGRLGYTWGLSGVTAGANYGFGRREAGSSRLGSFSIVGDKSLTTNTYHMLGADLRYDKGPLLWKNEVFYSFETGEENRLAFYTQPVWRMNDRWHVFYRFDYLDAGQGIEESIEHVIGLNFFPHSQVRVRAVFFLKEFERPATKAGLFQLSTTISF